MTTPVMGYALAGDADPFDELPLYANWNISDANPGISPLTQAQINALSAAQKPDGRVVWNTTARVLQAWDNTNGAWVVLQGLYRHLQTALAAATATAWSATVQGFSPGGALQSLTAAVNNPLAALVIRAADFTPFAVLNIRAWAAIGNTGPGVNGIFDLRPITIAGNNWNAGAPIAGSTVTLATPAANTVTDGASGDFALPADGLYALCFHSSGAGAAGSWQVGAQLRTRP